MAHYKRKRARIHMGRGSDNDLRRKFGNDWRWLQNEPSSWNNLYHTRPRRRKERQLERKVLKGVDPDGIAWPVFNKPHEYYW